jgi:sugar phosphate isomerase/epimerase
MELGIFAKTFPRPTLEQALDAVVSHGLTHIQFNMSCMGLATLPDKLDEGSCVWIAQSLRERGLSMAAISGTFNMVDPNVSRVEHNLRRLEVLAEACRWLDTRIITLCTGSLDSHDMWKWHPENARKSTWERLVETMRAAAAIADRNEVTLAFEPEINNVVSSVMRARRLLDEVGSPWLKVVIDPANLFHSGDLSRLREVLEEAIVGVWGPGGRFRRTGRLTEILDEAFDWVGADIVLAHAKNPPGIDEATAVRSEISPNLPLEVLENTGTERAEQEMRGQTWQQFYEPYLAGLNDVGFRGVLIMHGLTEDEVTARTLFLRGMLTALDPKQD